jgi:hypothetical protein
MNTQCVVREVRPGNHQYVLVSEVLRDMHTLVAGETIYVGKFDGQVEGFGPSASHKRTICTPLSRLTSVHAGDCVLREVSPGDHQYVPVIEAILLDGENVYSGDFRSQVERHGPSGSHSRTICLPAGELRVSTVQ